MIGVWQRESGSNGTVGRYPGGAAAWGNRKRNPAQRHSSRNAQIIATSPAQVSLLGAILLAKKLQSSRKSPRTFVSIPLSNGALYSPVKRCLRLFGRRSDPRIFGGRVNLHFREIRVRFVRLRGSILVENELIAFRKRQLWGPAHGSGRRKPNPVHSPIGESA